MTESPHKPHRDRESERILAGIGLVLVAVACFATLDTTAKLSTAAVPILMAIWFRYAFQAVATTLVASQIDHPRLGRLIDLRGLRAVIPTPLAELATDCNSIPRLWRGRQRLLPGRSMTYLKVRNRPISDIRCRELVAPKRPVA